MSSVFAIDLYAWPNKISIIFLPRPRVPVSGLTCAAYSVELDRPYLVDVGHRVQSASNIASDDLVFYVFVGAGFAAGTVVVPGDPKIGDLASSPTGLPPTAHIKANASHLIR